MKISNQNLKRIIIEETRRVLKEQPGAADAYTGGQTRGVPPGPTAVTQTKARLKPNGVKASKKATPQKSRWLERYEETGCNSHKKCKGLAKKLGLARTFRKARKLPACVRPSASGRASGLEPICGSMTRKEMRAADRQKSREEALEQAEFEEEDYAKAKDLALNYYKATGQNWKRNRKAFNLMVQKAMKDPEFAAGVKAKIEEIGVEKEEGAWVG